MPFMPNYLPKGMTFQEFERICYLGQLMNEPLELAPPVRKKTFLSANEIKLLSYLITWCPNFIVLTQVHLLQMINVDKNDIDQNFMSNYDYIFNGDVDEAFWKVFNMVNLLSVDFVLTDKIGSPVYAIELDGPEHQTDHKLIERDKIKTHVLKSIHIPFLRIKNEELASLNALQQKILSFAQ
jgi:hypothetical protein